MTLQRDGASLWTRGMIAVLIAQFLSAMADNALLFAALALLKSRHFPAWTGPLMQEFFVGAFIVLAPFAGPFADSNPKGRVMLLANGGILSQLTTAAVAQSAEERSGRPMTRRLACLADPFAFMPNLCSIVSGRLCAQSPSR